MAHDFIRVSPTVASLNTGAIRHSSSIITCGVPQGSMLSPLLSSAYVSPVGELLRDLISSVHSIVCIQVQFAVSGDSEGLELLKFAKTAPPHPRTPTYYYHCYYCYYSRGGVLL